MPEYPKKFTKPMSFKTRDQWKIEHKPPVKAQPSTKKVKSARPYSFSMEPALYNRLSKYCKERQVNMSAVIRRLIYIQLKDWALGENDLQFLEKAQNKKINQANDSQED